MANLEDNGNGGHGLRVHSRRGRIGRTWWSERWTGVLDSIGLGDRLHRGRSLARAGSVLSLAITPGEARAEVSGNRRETFDVRIAMEPIPEADWRALEEILSRRALFAARLLSGEMPPPIEEAFAEAGLSLFPSSTGELEAECTCADPARPCPHAAAVFYLMAEKFDEDPFLIFLFRGRKGSELLAGLKQRWASSSASEEEGVAGNGAAANGGLTDASQAPKNGALLPDGSDDAAVGSEDANDPERAAPADAGAEPDQPEDQVFPIETFWQMQSGLEALNPRIAAPVIPEALLRRLGPPPGATEDSLAEEALHKAYGIASAWALRLAMRDEGQED